MNKLRFLIIFLFSLPVAAQVFLSLIGFEDVSKKSAEIMLLIAMIYISVDSIIRYFKEK